jgi:hypothetical protein
MIQWRQICYREVTIGFVYQFLDQDGTPIPLTAYPVIQLELKLQGQLYTTTQGIITDSVTSQVSASFRPMVVGIWTAQFCATDQAGNKLWGEPVVFRVNPNVQDLLLLDLPAY